MKLKELYIPICCLIIGLGIGVKLMDLGEDTSHPKTTKWDGETTLGDPTVVMLVRNYQPAQPLTELKKTCDPSIILELSKELYDRDDKNNQPRHEVPKSQYSIVYMFSTGSRLISPVFIDNKNEVATSLNIKSHKLWKILDSIPKNSGNEPNPPGADKF